MSLAEGVQGLLAYKAYASGAITATALAVSSSDLGAASAQYLRRQGSTLKLAKDTYQASEIASHRQIQDFRHGVKRVTGSIQGEFSPGTYFDFFEASLRATKSASISFSDSDFTSCAMDASGTITFASGNPLTKGIRTGDILRFTNLSTAANNNTNFFVLGLSGSSNRVLSVYPNPTTMSADTAFNGTTNGASGKAVFMPASSFVSRKFGFEEYQSDIDITRLFTECRIGGINVKLPATGLSTVEFPVMGRDMEVYTAASAPFFSSPTAPTTTGITAAVNGLLRVGGSTVGVVTGLDISASLSPSSDAVVGQNFVPEIFLGRFNATGQMTAFLQDETFINYFKNETEISIIAFLTTSSSAAADAVSIYLPRIKFSDADAPLTGEAGQSITLPFQALKADGTTIGDEATTMRVVDTAAS